MRNRFLFVVKEVIYHPNIIIKLKKMSNKKHQLHYTYPPDLDKCNKHRLAMRIFKGLDEEKTGAECECCQRKIGTSQDKGQCWYDNLKLAYLGPGIPLLFTFIKNSILLLVVLTVLFTSFALYSNINGSYCQTNECNKNMFDNLSIINKIQQPSYMAIQNYTLLGFVLVSIVVFQYIRYNFRKVQDQCDDIITSPSDYALILRRLPQYTQKCHIQQMVQERRGFLTNQQRQKTDNLKVVNIVMAYSMSQFTKIKQQNKQQFEKFLDQGKHSQFKPKPLPKLQKPASFAIIVFSRQQSKQFFRYKPNICQKFLQCIWTPCIPRSDYRVKGEKIAVERAPEPDDIVWQNSKISQKGAICRKTIYSIISIIVLLIGGAVQYALAVAQVKASQDSQTQLILSLVSSVTVSVLNAIIQIFLVFTSQKERNQTLTQFNTVLMVKISFFQFLNTGVFVILANFLAEPNNFSLTKGFIFQVTQVMILNAIIPNLTLFILTYFEIINKIKRCLIEKQKIKNSQMEANSVYQGPAAQIPYKYAYVFKTIWLTAFYAPLAPIVVIVSLFGLIINYLLQKCLFGRVYSCPNMLSSMVNDSAVQLMQYFTLILSLGEYLVYLYFVSFRPELVPLYWGVPIYISIALSLIHLLLPMDGLNNKLFKMPKDNFVYPNYQSIEDKFQVTYQMTNPGYECNRKRKRDNFIFNKLFGVGGFQMTGINLLGGGAMGPAPPGSQNLPPQGGLASLLPGISSGAAHNIPQDMRSPLIGQQNNNIYTNQNQNNNNNNSSNNPLGNLFNPHNNQAINPNQINFAVNEPNTITNNHMSMNNAINMMAGPPPIHGMGQIINQNNLTSQGNQFQMKLTNQNAQGEENNEEYVMQPEPKKFPSPQNHNQLGGFNPQQSGAPKPVNFFKNVPPGFNAPMGPSYFEQLYNRPTFGGGSIILNGAKLGEPIPIGSQSQSSYSSTKQLKKAFKIPNNQLHPFTQGRFG